MPFDIRMYAGFAGQAGRLSAVRKELEDLLRSVVGLRRFRLLETTEGLAIVTEGENRAACEECASRAERWMAERLPGLLEYPPLSARGDVIAEVRVERSRQDSALERKQ
jgi:hypothetical protein